MEQLHTGTILYQKLKYLHQNPVRKEIVAKAEDYLYSSARDYAGMKEIYDELYDFYKVFDDCPDKYGVGKAILDDLKRLKMWLDFPIRGDAIKRLRGCSNIFSFDNLIKREFPNGKEKYSKVVFGLEPDFEFDF